MKLRAIIEEDCNHYKDFSMVLFAPYCNWKCCKESNIPVEECANQSFQKEPVMDFSNGFILQKYLSNPLQNALCIAGAESLDSDDLNDFIKFFRQSVNDIIIVYTGYTITEPKVKNFIDWIFKNNIQNVILKIGRYIPNDIPHIDPILEIPLASNNQFAIKINFLEEN